MQNNRFIDNSSNAFTLTVNGTPSVQRFSPFQNLATYQTSKIGGSGYFDGSGDYLVTSTSIGSLSGNFTFEAWTYMTGTSAQSRNIWCLGDASLSSGFQIAVADNGAVTVTNNGSNIINGFSAPSSLNQWVHWAAVRSSSTVTIYRNGTSLTTVSMSNTLSGVLYSGVEKFGATLDDYANGYHCDLRVTNAALYTTTFTPPTAPITTSVSTGTVQFLANFTNGAIYDNAAMNDLETVGNAQISTSVVKYGTGSMSFGGSSGNYLKSNPASSALYTFGTGNFTIEMWVYVNTLPGTDMVLYDGRPSNGAYPCIILQGSTNKLIWYVNTAVQITSSSTVTTGTWFHLAISRAGTNTAMFVNGNQSGSIWSDSTNYLGSVTRPYIGANATNGNESFNGYIDDLRITNGYARYWFNFQPPAAPYPNYGGTLQLTYDPYFSNTTLLLNGDGTNGAQNNTFLDSSTNNFTITRNGNTTQGSFSPYGSLWSNYFNSGNSSYLSVPDNAALELSTNSFTMEAWVFPTSFASTYAVLSKMTSSGTASGFLFNVSSSSGLLLFYASSNGSSWDIVSALGSINLALNSWNHIAVGRSGSTFRLWVNGSSSGTATSSGSVENNSASVLIGAAGQSSTANFANSYISNARIVNGTDVYGVSNSTITVPTTPLTAVTNTSLLTNFTNAGIPDLAMQNNLETVGNAQVSTSVKKYGTGSLSFNGSGSELLASSNPAQVLKGDFTIEGWVYLNNTTGLQTIIGRWQTSNQEYLFWVVSGVVQFYFSAFSVAVPLVTASSSLSATTWTHVAVTRSGSTFTVYINGTSAGTATNSSAMTVTTAATTIGSILPSFSGYDLNGYIDDLRVTNGLVRYTANFTPPASALPTY